MSLTAEHCAQLSSGIAGAFFGALTKPTEASPMAGTATRPKRKRPAKFRPSRASKIETIEDPPGQQEPLTPGPSASEAPHGLADRTIEVPLETARVVLYATVLYGGRTSGAHWHSGFECALPGLPLSASVDGRNQDGPPWPNDTAALLAAAGGVIGCLKQLQSDPVYARANYQRQIQTAIDGMIAWHADSSRPRPAGKPRRRPMSTKAVPSRLTRSPTSGEQPAQPFPTQAELIDRFIDKSIPPAVQRQILAQQSRDGQIKELEDLFPFDQLRWDNTLDRLIERQIVAAETPTPASADVHYSSRPRPAGKPRRRPMSTKARRRPMSTKAVPSRLTRSPTSGKPAPGASPAKGRGEQKSSEPRELRPSECLEALEAEIQRRQEELEELEDLRAAMRANQEFAGVIARVFQRPRKAK